MYLTLNEIENQYDALGKTISLIEDQEKTIDALYRETKPEKIIFTGCGSSYMVACSMRSIALTVLPVPVYAVASGDLWLNIDNYRALLDNAWIISFSRSGKTSEVLNAYLAIKNLDCHTKFISVTCSPLSPVERESDLVFCLPWACDQSVCQTRCVSNLYAAGALLIGIIAQDKKLIDGFSELQKIGNQYIKQIEQPLSELASHDWTHGIVLADGPYDGLAEEGALTFKEISQLPSNYYHLLDVRHGPIVVINQKSLVIIHLHDGERPQEIQLVRDIAKKGALVITQSNHPIIIEGATNFSLGHSLHEVASGIPFVNICQIITYFKSKSTGANPDAPTGLDPWIEL